MARYETMEFECWDRVDDIKEQIKQLEVIETKKERMRDVLMQFRAEIPALEAKVVAIQKCHTSGLDRSSSVFGLATTGSPVSHQSSAEAARARHRAERTEVHTRGIWKPIIDLRSISKWYHLVDGHRFRTVASYNAYLGTLSSGGQGKR